MTEPLPPDAGPPTAAPGPHRSIRATARQLLAYEIDTLTERAETAEANFEFQRYLATSRAAALDTCDTTINDLRRELTATTEHARALAELIGYPSGTPWAVLIEMLTVQRHRLDTAEDARYTLADLLGFRPDQSWPQILDEARTDHAAAACDSAYRERAHLVAHLAALHPSTIGRSDPDASAWPVVTITTPAGQMAWHINPDDTDLFGHVRPGHTDWDGHTTDEKYDRLKRLTDEIAPLREQAELELAEARADFQQQLAAERAAALETCTKHDARRAQQHADHDARQAQALITRIRSLTADYAQRIDDALDDTTSGTEDGQP